MGAIGFSRITDFLCYVYIGFGMVMNRWTLFREKNPHFFVNNKTKHFNDQTIYEQSMTHILAILHHILHFSKNSKFINNTQYDNLLRMLHNY